MKTTSVFCCALLVGALTLAPAFSTAQTKAKPAAAAKTTNGVTFKDYKLKNGLRVLLVEDHTAPVISLALNYDVGSRNEKQGRTGFAHLFEHMMFQGSANVGKSEHFILVDTNGGQMNGTTNEERTLYFESLPANQLDLMLFLESDRMKGLDITKENLDNQRNAVQEERRLGVDLLQTVVLRCLVADGGTSDDNRRHLAGLGLGDRIAGGHRCATAHKHRADRNDEQNSQTGIHGNFPFD